MKRVGAWLLLVAALGCNATHRTALETPGGVDGHAPPPATPPSPSGPAAAGDPGMLGTVVAAPVDSAFSRRPFEVALHSAEPRAGHARRFGSITMMTNLRQVPAITQYPCTSCHLGTRLIMADRRVPDAHQNIRPVHPKATGAVCSTCHSRDNVELLALRSGERPPLDHAYRLCAQCHFAQARAWAGGGHGKRLDGWQGRRVVMGCSDCHDPHRPMPDKRIPFPAPELEKHRTTP